MREKQLDLFEGCDSQGRTSRPDEPIEKDAEEIDPILFNEQEENLRRQADAEFVSRLEEAALASHEAELIAAKARAAYEALSPEEKREIYARKVFPESYDPKIRAAGDYWMKRIMQGLENHKQGKPWDYGYENDSRIDKNKRAENTGEAADDGKDRDDKDDPYSDTYPYSRNWRR